MTIQEQTGLSPEELAQLCRQRESMYTMLSQLFIKEPAKEYLGQLRQGAYPVNTGNSKVDQGYRLLATYLSNIWENSALELAVDFARCFVGHGMDAKCAAYPYESVYTTEKRLLMQGARDEVRVIYASMGLDKLATLTDEDDHVAFELAFMETMCHRAAEAAEAGDEEEALRLLDVQENFLAEHLGLWAPTFARDMRDYAQTGFYQGASLLLEGFMELESELFGIDYSVEDDVLDDEEDEDDE